jgi:hypothetical protein
MTTPAQQDNYEIVITASKNDSSGDTATVSIYAKYLVDPANPNKAFHSAYDAYRSQVNDLCWNLGVTLTEAKLKRHTYDDGTHVEIVLLDDSGKSPEVPPVGQPA